MSEYVSSYTGSEIDDLLARAGTLSNAGNAVTASKLTTARTITLTGSVTGSGNFDGSSNLNISTITNHTHDERYYTESEVSELLNNKKNKSDFLHTKFDRDVSSTSMEVGSYSAGILAYCQPGIGAAVYAFYTHAAAPVFTKLAGSVDPINWSYTTVSYSSGVITISNSKSTFEIEAFWADHNG